MFRFYFAVFSTQIFVCFALIDDENIKEIGFKFWLQPGSEECYHELLKSGSTLFFIYEILNVAEDRTHIVAYFRHAANGSLVAFSQTSDRGHLQFVANETTLIDICLDHPFTRSPPKYLSLFIHVYHHEKIFERYQQMEILDNVSISVRTSVNSMIDHLIISRQTQIELEMLNQRDLYLLYEISHWITKWALLHCFIIVFCVAFQTYFIKGFFRI